MFTLIVNELTFKLKFRILSLLCKMDNKPLDIYIDINIYILYSFELFY